jgi:hypothetical protein
MNIWSKVLVGVILAMTLPFFYLSLRLLKTNQAWRSEVNKYERAVWDTVHGRPGQLALDDLERSRNEASVKLHGIVFDRGRVWRNANPEKAFNASTGQGTVAVETPVPHRITPKMLLFVFAPEGYLGEFQVTDAGEKSIGLMPNMQMSERQLKRVSSSPGNWTLYEVMPVDRHDVFAGLDKVALEKMLPGDKVDEYLKDGQPAQAGDPADRVVDGKYVRPLTDYGYLFHELDREISVATDLRNAAAKDAKSLEAALADAKRQVEYRQKEMADLKQELARSQAERDLMSAQCEALASQLGKVRGEMKATYQQNKQLAKDWARIQATAAAAAN